MKLKSLSFYKYRFKRKNTKSVKCRSTVQHNWMFTNNFIKNSEYFRSFLFYKHFCLFNIENNTLVYKLFHDKRLEKFKSHFCWKTTLPELKFRSNNDYGTTRVVYALTKKVLAETSLLTLNHVRDRLKRTVRCTLYNALALRVIKQCIYSFLKHTLFVSDNDIRSRKLLKSLKAIITVNNTTIQIVKVRCSKTSAIKLYHRTKIRRNYRNYIQNHP